MKEIIGKIHTGPKALKHCIIKINKKLEPTAIDFFDGLKGFFEVVICDCQTIASYTDSTIKLSDGFLKRMGDACFVSPAVKSDRFIFPDSSHNPHVHSINLVEITKPGKVKPIDIFEMQCKIKPSDQQE